MAGRGVAVALLALAIGARALVALRTFVPGRDGATYLWMAERVAAGDLGAAFDTVFHPLYPLLTGGLLWGVPGLGPMAAGQIVAGGAGALAVLPLSSLTAHRFGAAAGWVAGLAYALGLWCSRYPAECMSEGPFYLAVSTWAWALLGAVRRPRLAAVAAAAAFALRPEGIALAVLGVWWEARAKGRPGRLALWAGAGIALVPLGYALAGAGPVLTPKLGFNLGVGIGAAQSPVAHYAEHALRAVGSAFEVIGYLWLPLAVWGASRVPRAQRATVLLLVAPLLLQLAVIPLLRSHVRFLSGFGILALPLAAAAVVGLGMWRWWVVALALAPDLARLPAPRGEDRVVERELGRYLRRRLPPDRTVVTEMPRLEFFAGQRPGPPRPLARAELLAACGDARAAFAVLVATRSDVHEGDLQALGFVPLSLPPALSKLAHERGLLVYHRP